MIHHGKSISPGFAQGPVFIVGARSVLERPPQWRRKDLPDAELERLHAAIGVAGVQLMRVTRSLGALAPAGSGDLRRPHARSYDPQFVGQIEEEIEAKCLGQGRRGHGPAAPGGGLRGSSSPLVNEKRPTCSTLAAGSSSDRGAIQRWNLRRGSSWHTS